MAVAIIQDDTKFTGIGSDGKRTAKRIMIFSYESGDDTMTLGESALLPSINDLHPTYTAWAVQDIGEPEFFDTPRRFKVEITYVLQTMPYSGVWFKSRNKKPWELGAQDFQQSTYDIERPLLTIFRPANMASYTDDAYGAITGTIDLLNTAGDRIIATEQIPVKRLSFKLHYRHTSGSSAPVNDAYSYNSLQIKVCNITIPPYAGKLLPFTTTLNTVYKADGTTVDYQYDTAQITIDILIGDTWKKEFLNVGTQAVFADGSKGALFRYHLLSGPNDMPSADNVEYGSWEDVVKQRQIYLGAGGKGANFPYEEMTEPFPLDQDGAFDLAAFEDKEYLKVRGYPKEGEDWSRFNFPQTI